MEESPIKLQIIKAGIYHLSLYGHDLTLYRNRKKIPLAPIIDDPDEKFFYGGPLDAGDLLEVNGDVENLFINFKPVVK